MQQDQIVWRFPLALGGLHEDISLLEMLKKPDHLKQKRNDFRSCPPNFTHLFQCTLSLFFSLFFPLSCSHNILVLEGDNCVFDGVIYRSGEKFEPNCQYHCTCRDGQIGCVPRCQLDVLLPGPDCPAPRKVAVPGECCEKWTCGPNEKGTLGGLALPGEPFDILRKGHGTG